MYTGYDEAVVTFEPVPTELVCEFVGCTKIGQTQKVVELKVVELHRDPTECYKLECGHWVI